MQTLDAFKYCPRCGSKFVNQTQFLKCSNCGLNFYNNPAPTASVVFYNNKSEYLLVERAIDPQKGFLDVVGGFVDGSETFEQCAVRETKEELGLDILAQDLKYIGSFTSTYLYQDIESLLLNVAFIAQIPGSSVLKPADDVAGFMFFELNKIPHNKLAFPWITQMLKVLANTKN